MKALEGQVAIVTGGGTGIGHSTAVMLADEGAQVVIAGRRKPPLDEVVAQIERAGGTCVARQADLGKVADAVELARWTIERFGRVDVLVNNAGHSSKARNVRYVSPDEWESVVAVNLTGVYALTQGVLPGMVERGGGKVVTIASDAGRVGSSGEAPYSACKGGIIALTKTLAREMASKNIQLNVVCPGLTETGMLEQFMQGAGNPDKLREAYRRAIPLGRLGKPEDLPGAVLFFASDDADFITGQVLSVSGGLTMHG